MIINYNEKPCLILEHWKQLNQSLYLVLYKNEEKYLLEHNFKNYKSLLLYSKIDEYGNDRFKKRKSWEYVLVSNI